MARDDFTQKTKALAAQRVAYRCSFKNCGIPTIGPKYGDKASTTNIGVACHICAASSRGPRYDSDMTPEERKSIENCIWMCQTHSTLIDKEDKKYTVEVLRQWKKDAEQKAAEAIADYKITENKLRDPQKLSLIFDNLINEGNYDVLKCMLEQNSNFNEENELLLRYNVIYAIYCNRNELVLRTQDYINQCKNPNIEELIKYFIAFNVMDGIDLLIPLCQDKELLMFADVVYNKAIEGKLIGKKDDIEPITFSDKGCLIKLLSTYIVDCFTSPIQDAEGKTLNIFDAEFAFKMRKLAWQIICDGIKYGKYYSEKSQNDDFIVLKTNLHKIRQLDIDLQKIIWIACLNYTINNKVLFREVYGYCPLFVQELHEIKRLIMNFSGIHKLEDNDGLLNDCLKNNQEDFLFDILKSETKDKQKLFLDEHKYLLKNNVELLLLWINLLPVDKRYSVVQSYKEFYSNNFLWHCMDAYYSQNQIIAEGSLQWLNSNTIRIPYDAIDFYASVLKKYEMWDSLENLLHDNLPSYYKYRVSLALSSFDNFETKNKCIDTFISLETEGFDYEGFYFNFAVLYCNIGDKEKAKGYFEKEYISYPKSQALIQLFQLRYQTKDFKKDGFFDAACKMADFELQHLIAAISYESSEIKEAKFYILRSLLINCNNPIALNAYFIWESEHPDNNIFANDKVYYLKNENSNIKVALHDPKLLEYITPQNFMDCIHLDCNDTRILTLSFETKGSKVKFEDQDYIIAEIKSFEEELNTFVFSQVLSSEKTLKITGATPEEAVENLRQQLMIYEDSKQQIIDIYNQMDGKYPLSLFARSFGHGLCNTWGFVLCQNSKELNNNIIFNIPGNSTYLLAIDAIQTLGVLDVLNNFDISMFAFAPQSKPILLEEFNTNIQDYKSTSAGVLGISNGKLSGIKYTPESKKAAVSYWAKMKKFVEQIKELEGGIFNCTVQDVQKFFVEQELTYESYLLGTMQKQKNTVLVTDDPFLSFVCQIEKAPYISAVNLLLLCKFDFEAWISILNKLKELNFSNYITPSIYKELINMIRQEGQEECRAKKITALNNWLLPDGCENKHRQTIIDLYKYLVLEDINSSYAYSLSNIALEHLSILNPESFNKLLESAAKEFYTEIGFDNKDDESD